MKRPGILIASILLAYASALGAEQVYYQIDLLPSGRVISQDAPVAKGGTVVFHRYPDGTLMSMRRADIKSFMKIAPQEASATLPKEKLVQIGNLAFQGGSQQAGPTSTSAVGAKAAPAIGSGFYGNVVPGSTQAMPNSANDNVVGRSWAAPPGNSSQAAPGAPPSNPAATSGSNPPQ